MIAAAVLMLAAPQAAPAVEDVEEVVVTARVGRVALIFDRAPDGRLINCRVFVSSGTRRVDDEACTSLPDCLTSTAGREYCGGTGAGLTAVAPKLMPTPEPKLGLGKLLTPEPPKTPAVGPVVAGKEDEDPNRLGKLPPPPKDESGTPAITLGPMKQEEPR
ncbi:energy transducer TonB [Sphingomonas suaedae]|uniref:Energy transducer TonB n=1 Tax=Sphingomonas suaedae TaxID=2599297 RepID=A0A518RGI8_9SPHN|nr:energy transducer TonB [Sphingomonas suaedae]QDX26566.1 energy transducer TonB [Sphingomonas suaedae]